MTYISKYVLDQIGLYNDLFGWSNDDWALSSPIFSVKESEDKTSLIVTTPLPGIKKENVEVWASDNCLWVTVTYKNKNRTDTAKRGTDLDNVVPESAVAKLEDGILTVTLRKRDKPKGHKVAVS